jgi:hypothetical protein
MQVMKFIDYPSKARTTLVEFDNVEFVNPIHKLMKDVIDGYVNLRLSNFEFAKEHNKPSPFDKYNYDEIVSALKVKGIETWSKYYKEIMESELSSGIFKILECNNKDEQKRILNDDIELTSFSLSKFIIQAYKEYGFKYSMYRFTTNPKTFDGSKMPPFAYKNDDNTIRTIGNTTMKDGEIKNAIDHRKVTIAKFLDKGDIWHCFFYDYKSMNGKEADGTPHIHYISNAWTLSREFSLQKFKEGLRPSSSTPHINYKR